MLSDPDPYTRPLSLVLAGEQHRLPARNIASLREFVRHPRHINYHFGEANVECGCAGQCSVFSMGLFKFTLQVLNCVERALD